MTVKPAAACMVWVLVTMVTARGPSTAEGDTETVATREVADRTCVDETVTPAPKVGVVRPATNCTFDDPSIRTGTAVAPRLAVVVCGSVI